MPLSADHLKDLTHARLRLEVMILRDSIEGAGMEWETAVVSNHYALNRTDKLLANGSLNPVWLQAHRSLHHALGSGCGSPQLIAITSALRDSAELYRAWAHTLAHDTERDVAGEHDRIVAAALARDSDATEALATHIRHTSEVLLRYAAGAALG
jgi:DNA-binding GntR family transcriptional regulator